ncbi:uncharacterized protein BX663DRAFT_515994 [Cokeromyces recurvatus]|uniref:uncharacterized protein n=1 Tax=Cokeromyces recurvatus TaxID=90255 RepID=UPI00221F3A1A|nr:uncharacterized protein BX663DRAFT_515994 [Cokeromyces recurvatus]KAI7901009.1 hypothetical protein BX663DRAFT_515994 [Cokeromyces recurvatus]
MTEEEIEQILASEDLTPELQNLINEYKELKEQSINGTNELYAIGDHCAIPFSYNDLLFLLPAIILSYDSAKTLAQVLILTPVTSETIPCTDYFGSQEHCTTDVCQVNRSHGYTIATEYITSFEALEADTFHYEQRVWCQEDELWKLGEVIDEVDDEELKHWRVRLLEKRQQQTVVDVDREHIIPFKSLLDEDDQTEAIEEDCIPEVISKPVSEAFGCWQAHTTGFAAKMMQKMGYVHGQGLGIQGQGRVEPVEANKVYSSRSQYHENRPGLGLVSKKGIQKRKKKEKVKEGAEEIDMFSMMNTLLGKQSQEDNIKQKSTIIKSLNEKQANQTIAKLQSKLDKAELNYIHAKEALRRNKGSPMESQFKTKLKNANHTFETLKNEMSELQRHVKRTKEQKEMYTF